MVCCVDLPVGVPLRTGCYEDAPADGEQWVEQRSPFRLHTRSMGPATGAGFMIATTRGRRRFFTGTLVGRDPTTPPAPLHHWPGSTGRPPADDYSTFAALDNLHTGVVSSVDRRVSWSSPRRNGFVVSQKHGVGRREAFPSLAALIWLDSGSPGPAGDAQTGSVPNCG
jgi:hypothetical protein